MVEVAKQNAEMPEAKTECNDSLVKTVTWRHYFFFVIHFLQNIFFSFSYNPMRQYLYAKIANQHIKNTTYAINSTFDIGGNSLCWSKNASSDRDKTQQHVQADVAMWYLYVSLSVGIPPILVWFYLGYLTDMFGRKPMLILNNLGYAIRLAVYAVVIYWDLPTGYLLIGAFFEGFFGSYPGNNQLTIIYIADITKKGKMRGFIIAVTFCLSDVFYGATNFLSGYIIKNFGFFWPITFSAIILFVLTAMIYFFVAETLKEKDKNLSPTKGMKSVLSFFLRKTEDDWKTRFKFWLCFIPFALVTQALVGKWDLSPLFTMNSPFCWTSVEVGYFNGAVLLLQATTTILILYILQKFFTHEMIAVFGLLSMITENLVWAFSSKSWMLYLCKYI